MCGAPPRVVVSRAIEHEIDAVVSRRSRGSTKRDVKHAID
jgi:hypothetical protein